MTDEQIKVLEDQLKGMVELNTFSGRKPLPALTKFTDALTAAIEFIRDMREIEAVTVQITIVSGDLPDRGVKAHDIFNVGDGWIYNDKRFNSRCEAFKAVKGGKG